ncbi:LacI family transcriptional regulator [Sunxiuqinia elliptica]|uniref:LacI family transcriptional regulator n=1 Tax=Sunxiuqinia elliptica TaxID=655355 RepID=A0A4R6GS96_9BACT|nr:LacI family transcriptional regulator [Sunxiuqinia elliptica]
MSKKTRNKILKIIEELDYQPNILASTLASKKVYSFAVLIPEPQSTEAYWNKPLHGISKALQEIQPYGVEVTIYQFKQNDPALFKKQAEQLLAHGHDGIVLAPFFSRESKAFINKLEELNIPFVFIDSNIKESPKLSYIGQNSFQSGALAAKLLNFSMPANSPALVIHFAKEMDNQNHLVQREMGFYNYFKEQSASSSRSIRTVEINNTDHQAYFKQIEEELKNSPQVGGIFVTNSQVYKVAEYLESKGMPDIRLIGYDLIPANADFVRKDLIDFLICQRPEEQGYQAVSTLFQHLVLKKEVASENYTSIDILTKENLDFYQEFKTSNYGPN